MNLAIVTQQLERFEQDCGGKLGVHAKHIETNNIIQYKSDEYFYMCSTVKLPIVLCLLDRVEHGFIKLSDLYEVSEYDLRIGVSSTLTQLDYTINPKLSIINLIKFMLQESCNSCSDIILRLVGGPSAVMDYLKKISITEINVKNFILEAFAKDDGIKNLPANHRVTLAQYQELQAQAATKNPPAKNTERNNVTPLAMNNLLLKLFNNELLTIEHKNLLLKIMRGCKTGATRLRGLLPKNTSISHKTGTITGYVNDVGIITLPFDCGNIAISVFIKESPYDLITNERVLAEVSRTIYDIFLLQL